MKRKNIFYQKNGNIKNTTKLYKVIIGILVGIILCMGYYLFLNYDYLAFKHFISGFYIYDDVLDDLYKDVLDLDDPKYYKNFDNLTIAVMTAYIREAAQDRYTYQYLPEQYKQSKETEKKEAEKSYIEEISADTVYLKVSNFSKYTKRIIKNGQSDLAAYNNIIIDLRGNPGGELDVLHFMLELFLDKGMVMSYDITRYPIFNKTVKAKKAPALLYEHIVILQDGSSASASEGFIVGLKDNYDHVTLVGETTFGKGIGQYTLPLKNGYAVKATVLEWQRPQGGSIHKTGIPPDINYSEEDIIDFVCQEVLQK